MSGARKPGPYWVEFNPRENDEPDDGSALEAAIPVALRGLSNPTRRPLASACEN